jgi:NAD-dependent dihydropyrimidine dehydrogenase PreA subunit
MSIFTNHVDRPTYEKDIVGEISRWDERDIVFARTDLFQRFGEGSPEFEAYYAGHPDYLEYDRKISQVYSLGESGGIDEPMVDAQMGSATIIGANAVVDGGPSPERTVLPPTRAAEKVKALARFLGADAVGIGPLRREWTYSHAGRPRGEDFLPWGAPIDLSHHPNAIALGFQMDYDLIQSAPDFPTMLATAKGYAIGAWVAVQLAAYIRQMGYSARAHHLGNYQVLCVPVAVDCGLGELSRAGFLLSEDLGLGLRLGVVTTDMPLQHDRPVDIAVQSFCEVCKICAESCPIGAIPMGDKIDSSGVRKWKLDEEKCYRYWQAVGTDCAVCMAACPWTRPRRGIHRLAAGLASVRGPHQWLLTQGEKLVYGKFKSRPRPDFLEPPGR